MTAPINPAPVVSLVNEQPRTLSTDVAVYFGKQHKDVLRQIRKIVEQCDADYRERNFAPTFVNVPGPNNASRKDPAYSMTRDGFTLLAMGFTGKEALKWKIRYIEAFNAMEAELAARARDGFRLTGEEAPRQLDAPSTVKDRKALGGLIATWVGLAPLSYRDAWQQVKAAFGVAKAEDLTLSQLKPACDWVQARIDRALAPEPAAAHQIDPEDFALAKEMIQRGATRALENYKNLAQICKTKTELDRQIHELETRTWDDYKALDQCRATLSGYKPCLVPATRPAAG